MLWDLMNFALIGVFLGVIAQMLFLKNRSGQPAAMAITVVPCMIGAVLGGTASWYFWPVVDGQFHYGGFATAIAGAVIMLGLVVSYLRHSDKLT